MCLYAILFKTNGREYLGTTVRSLASILYEA